MFNITILAFTAIFILLIGLVIVRRKSKYKEQQGVVINSQADIRKRKQSATRANLQQLLDVWCSVSGKDSKHIARM